jgi:hypothetical protein
MATPLAKRQVALDEFSGRLVFDPGNLADRRQSFGDVVHDIFLQVGGTADSIRVHSVHT